MAKKGDTVHDLTVRKDSSAGAPSSPPREPPQAPRASAANIPPPVPAHDDMDAADRPDRGRDYLSRLSACGLLSQSDFKSLVASLDPLDFELPAEVFAAKLATLGKLTDYQAKAVLYGNSRLFYGNYAVLDRIGAGGVATVFRAQHRDGGDIVAIKVISAEDKRVDREVRMGAKLDHPHIVKLLDHGYDEQVEFLVMEYIDGKDFAGYIAQHGPLSVREAVAKILETCRAVAYLHENRIIHRDIKPQNMLVAPDSTVRLLDLGLARFDMAGASYADRLTQEDAVLGTPAFMAPEQIMDPRSADQRADLYSLGCTLYFLLVGVAPIQKKHPMDTMEAQLSEPPPSLKATRKDVPDELEQIYQRLLCKKPEQRYQSVDELIAALEALNLKKLSAKPPGSGHAVVDEHDHESEPEPPSRFALLPLLVVAIVVAAALAVWFYFF